MTREEFDHYCRSLKATTHVVQWGGASVWKIGGKIFAICSDWGPNEISNDQAKISFKCSDHTYQILCELPGIIPAPYLARAKWVQVISAEALSDEDIQDYISKAYEIITSTLSRKFRTELGL